MKIFRVICLVILLPSPLLIANNSILKELDQTIKQAHIYVEEKEMTLLFFRDKLYAAETDTQIFDIATILYREYRSYKYDSAFVYAGKMLYYAGKLQNPDFICESKIALAFSCLSAGLYKEAAEISHSIDTSYISGHNKALLNDFLSVLYMSMSDFAATGPYYDSYRVQSLHYCQRAISLYDPDSPEALLVRTRKSQLLEDYESACETAEQYLSHISPDKHNYAIAVSMLAYYYEILGDTEKAIDNFALAAIADIKLAIKETSAIRQLGELLFSQGDIARAYAYAMLALDDANFYNARHRKIEVGRTLPIIEAGRFEIIAQQKDKLLVFSTMLSVLFIFLVIATVIILFQKKKLNAARMLILKQNADLLSSNRQLKQIQQKISRQNEDLLNTNKKLKEAHQIKDEYIGFFFNTTSSYLEKKEAFTRMVMRKIKSRKFDELLEEFSASDLRKEKEEMFTMFDKIFIKIFPDFVNRYNQLFNEEYHFVPKPDGALSPEIRIFALIRLGINKNESIARFLDFSLSTVKNYKSMAKNRSNIANELFEQYIMEIDSVETGIN